MNKNICLHFLKEKRNTIFNNSLTHTHKYKMILCFLYINICIILHFFNKREYPDLFEYLKCMQISSLLTLTKIMLMN